MAKVFILKGKYEGRSVRLMNRYNFVDGVHLEESDDDAKKKYANLCEFYPCTMMDHEEYVRTKMPQKSPASPPPTTASPAVAPKVVKPAE